MTAAMAGRGASLEEGAPVERFGARVQARVAARESQLVLGLDPDPSQLWPRAVELAGGPGDPPRPASVRAALAVALHCALAIEATAEHCVAVKLQVACFERLGAPGWAALDEVACRAREHQLLVIADAKRGDVPVSARAYAQAFFGETPTLFGPVAGLGADALTVSPLLGKDSLRPLLDGARAGGGGLFALVRTSNAGASELQELPLREGMSFSERLARMVDELGCEGDDVPATSAASNSPNVRPLSDVGAVVGATAPSHFERLRELMPRAIFLIPGVGTQGGRIDDLSAAFVPGRAGGLISVSRSLVDAHRETGGEPAASAARAAEQLRGAAWAVSGEVAAG